jgi:SAM-dependent methyltransferase
MRGKVEGVMLLVMAAIALALPRAGAQSNQQSPIIDMHLHADHVADYPPGPGPCSDNRGKVRNGWDPQRPIERLGSCTTARWPAPKSDDELLRKTVAMLDRHNIRAVTSGTPEDVMAHRGQHQSRLEATVDAKTHWNQLYQTKGPDQMSWFEPEATLSIALIQGAAPTRNEAIIDVGAGSATLVDGLLNAGYHRLTVLDLSAAALEQARRRLGQRARAVEWREADILTANLEARAFDIWHDRAVFHFLTNAADRHAYVAQVRHALRPGGFALVATFAKDGPARCSGLEVARYSPDSLHAEFGDDFRLLASEQRTHVTPWGVQQPFTYCLCRYEPHALTRHAA